MGRDLSSEKLVMWGVGVVGGVRGIVDVYVLGRS